MRVNFASYHFIFASYENFNAILRNIWYSLYDIKEVKLLCTVIRIYFEREV